MRKVGQFRYLLRRPPPPKVLDSPDLVQTQYGPLRKDKQTIAKKKSARVLASDWVAATAPARPAEIVAPVGSIDRHATFMVLREHMLGDTSHRRAFERPLAQLVDCLCDLGCSAYRAFDEVTRRQMSAELIGYIYRAARRLGQITGTTQPGLEALDLALGDAGVPPDPVVDADPIPFIDENGVLVFPDAPPSQGRVIPPNTSRRRNG